VIKLSSKFMPHGFWISVGLYLDEQWTRIAQRAITSLESTPAKVVEAEHGN